MPAQKSEEVTLVAADGTRLAGTLRHAQGVLRAAVLIGSATGVHRRYYDPFATYLADAGLATLTLDYRGVGGSLEGSLRASKAKMHDWGELDLAAGLALLSERFPAAPLLHVGHSVGGQLLGLVPAAQLGRVRAMLAIAAQSGYWRNWSGLQRLQMFLHWHGLMDLAALLFGYLPMRRFAGGEDIPSGVAREWARWGRDPQHILGYARSRGAPDGFANWAGALRSVAIADDTYAPLRAVEALAGFYTSARRELRVVSPRELNVPRIGHFGFFVRRFRDTLWREAREWLLAQAGSRKGKLEAGKLEASGWMSGGK